jgi:hypothetical protein
MLVEIRTWFTEGLGLPRVELQVTPSFAALAARVTASDRTSYRSRAG